jgi:uncharacterized membrane protein YeiH
MSITPFQVTLWIELLAAGLGGLQGALFAAGNRSAADPRPPSPSPQPPPPRTGNPAPGRIDVLGVIAIGLAVSLGGSLLRDLVLNQPPVVVWSNWYLLTAAASAVLGMALQPALARADWLITVLDAVVMGLFGAIGASKALSLGVGVTGALVVGVIGAIGGGMLRDVMLSLPFSFLHVGTLYAVAAGAGTAGLILLAGLGTPIPIAGLACVLLTTLIRLAAVHYDWTFPEQFALHPHRPKPQP